MKSMIISIFVAIFSYFILTLPYFIYIYTEGKSGIYYPPLVSYICGIISYIIASYVFDKLDE